MSDDSDYREIVMDVVGELESKLEELKGTQIPMHIALHFQAIWESLRQIRLGA